MIKGNTSKGKQPTRGAKQILMENGATVRFYRNMSIAAVSIYFVIMLIDSFQDLGIFNIILNIIIMSLHIGCYYLMKYISRPTYSADSNQLIDPGTDLNMEGGMAEHIKDVVILSSITHVLAALHNGFWLALLLVPLRACWLVWKNILGPWFFQQAPDEEQEDKKRKKMDKKMKRVQFVSGKSP